MPIPPRRLILTGLALILTAGALAAALDMWPRVRDGVGIEGLHWVQAAGSMFWAMPLTACAIVGAWCGYAVQRVAMVRRRIAGAGFVGAGAVSGAAAFVAMGTPWYEAIDGIALQSWGLAGVVFGIAAAAFLVALRGRSSTRAGS